MRRELSLPAAVGSAVTGRRAGEAILSSRPLARGDASTPTPPSRSPHLCSNSTCSTGSVHSVLSAEDLVGFRILKSVRLNHRRKIASYNTRGRRGRRERNTPHRATRHHPSTYHVQCGCPSGRLGGCGVGRNGRTKSPGAVDVERPRTARVGPVPDLLRPNRVAHK